jgi:hypothetical protein
VIRANRTTMRILGIKLEEVAGTLGMSLVPDTLAPNAACAMRSSRSDTEPRSAASCSNCAARRPAAFEPAESKAVDTPRALTLSRPAVLRRNELQRQELESIAIALTQTGGKVFGPGGSEELPGMKPTPLLRESKLSGPTERPGHKISVRI